jgi:hypothetical protein
MHKIFTSLPIFFVDSFRQSEVDCEDVVIVSDPVCRRQSPLGSAPCVSE